MLLSISLVLVEVNKELPPHKAVSWDAALKIVDRLVGSVEKAQTLKHILDRLV